MLLVDLNICDKSLLVHITQASCLSRKTFPVRTQLIYLRCKLRPYIHQSHQNSIDITSLISIAAFLNFLKKGTMSVALYTRNILTHCCAPIFLAHWLYDLVMSRTRFRVNPHSIAAWMSRNYCDWTRTQNYFLSSPLSAISLSVCHVSL